MGLCSLYRGRKLLWPDKFAACWCTLKSLTSNNLECFVVDVMLLRSSLSRLTCCVLSFCFLASLTARRPLSKKWGYQRTVLSMKSVRFQIDYSELDPWFINEAHVRCVNEIAPAFIESPRRLQCHISARCRQKLFSICTDCKVAQMQC